ncbi:MAG: hypothetical protein ABW170_23100 [Candidatus Thiodiazotropha sp. L084R]
MSIKQDIERWDGKSASDIGAVYDNYHIKPDFLDITLLLKSDVSYQKGATWLLKKWLESGNQLQAEHIKNVYSSLQLLKDWESKLHILQSIPYMPIDKNEKLSVESFLRGTLTDSNKFVRAWSYNGFYELAKQYPEYAEKVKQLFEMALSDEAASVRARIRNIMKKGF